MIEMDFRNIGPTLWNLLMFALMALFAIPATKVFFSYFPIPGFRTLAAAM